MKRYFENKKILVLVLLCCCFVGNAAMPAVASSDNLKVKAVFLFKFFKYISWSESVSSKNTVCVYGVNPFGDSLDYILEEKIGSSNYSVKYINSTSQIKQCKLMFVSDSSARGLTPLLGHKGVLTVSDIKGFVSKGGNIELSDSYGKIQIILNKSSLKKAGLAASSKLMKIAEVVE